jgi:hypothetical protein
MESLGHKLEWDCNIFGTSTFLESVCPVASVIMEFSSDLETLCAFASISPMFRETVLCNLSVGRNKNVIIVSAESYEKIANYALVLDILRRPVRLVVTASDFNSVCLCHSCVILL